MSNSIDWTDWILQKNNEAQAEELKKSDHVDIEDLEKADDTKRTRKPNDASPSDIKMNYHNLDNIAEHHNNLKEQGFHQADLIHHKYGLSVLYHNPDTDHYKMLGTGDDVGIRGGPVSIGSGDGARRYWDKHVSNCNHPDGYNRRRKD